MKMLNLILWVGLLVNVGVKAEELKVDASQSSLTFAGQHAGRDFSGAFNTWQATLVLQPLQEASIKATFSLASAKTGNALYDDTLVESDWFNADAYPTASFSSTEITLKNDVYQVSGDLIIRDVSQPVSFELGKTPTGYSAQFTIDRLVFGIGLESDPDADWVSRNIEIALQVNR